MVEQLLEQRSGVTACRHFAVTSLVRPGQDSEHQAVIQAWLEAAYDEVVLVNSALAEVREGDEQRLPMAVRWVDPALLAYKRMAQEMPESEHFVEAQHLVPRNSDIHRMAYRRVRDALRFSKESSARDMSGLPYAQAVALGQTTLPYALGWIDASNAAPSIPDLEATLQQHMHERQAA